MMIVGAAESLVWVVLAIVLVWASTAALSLKPWARRVLMPWSAIAILYFIVQFSDPGDVDRPAFDAGHEGSSRQRAAGSDGTAHFAVRWRGNAGRPLRAADLLSDDVAK